MLDTKSSVLITALVMCIIYFAWMNSRSQTREIETLRAAIVQLQPQLRQAQPQAQAQPQPQPQPQQPAFPSGGGSLSSSVVIPRHVAPSDMIGERPPPTGDSLQRGDGGFHIGRGMTDPHFPEAPTVPDLPSYS